SSRRTGGSSTAAAPVTWPRPFSSRCRRTASMASRLVPDMMPIYGLALPVGMAAGSGLRAGNLYCLGFRSLRDGWPAQPIDMVAVLRRDLIKLLTFLGIEGASHGRVHRERVPRLVRHTEFVVQMRPGGPAGGAHTTDQVALRHLHAFLDALGETF